MAKTALAKKLCRGSRCKTFFTPRRRDQVYCGESCRVQDYKERYYASTTVEKECPECNALFSTTCPEKQKYCTPECRGKSQKRGREAKAAQKYAEKLTFLGDRYSALEKSGFRCTACGRGAEEVILDVETGKNGSLQAICVECKAGREFTGKEGGVKNA